MKLEKATLSIILHIHSFVNLKSFQHNMKLLSIILYIHFFLVKLKSFQHNMKLLSRNP